MNLFTNQVWMIRASKIMRTSNLLTRPLTGHLMNDHETQIDLMQFSDGALP